MAAETEPAAPSVSLPAPPETTPTFPHGLFAVLLSILLPAFAAADVVVRHTGDSRVTVRYELAQPLTELHFKTHEPQIRTSYWRVEAPFEISGGAITASAPFTRVTASLLPNDRPLDRVYASLVTLDEASSIVNLDYVRLAEGAPITVVNAYDPERRACVPAYEPSFETAGDRETIGRYVMVSERLEDCRERLERSDGRLFFSEEVRPTLAAGFSQSVTSVYEDLERAFGVAPAQAPIVFVTWDRTADRNTFQGDVGWRSVISLRFYGEAWDALDEEQPAELMSFLTHELVHLWIGKLVRVDDGDGLGHAWLHEGAAEYLSLLTLVRRGDLSEEAFREQLGSRITDCGRRLGSQALLTDRQPAVGRVIYDCGVLVQLVYDLVAHAESGGERGVVDLWRTIVERPGESEVRTYTSSGFIDAYPRAKELLSGALFGPAIEPRRIGEILEELEVEIAAGDPVEIGPWAAAILIPLLHADCEAGPIGFYTYEDSLELDANETCPEIPEGFVVRHVQGIDLMQEPAQAYDAAVRSCAAGGSLRFSGRTPDDPELVLGCATLAERPVDIEIRKIPLLDL